MSYREIYALPYTRYMMTAKVTDQWIEAEEDHYRSPPKPVVHHVPRFGAL